MLHSSNYEQSTKKYWTHYIFYKTKSDCAVFTTKCTSYYLVKSAKYLPTMAAPVCKMFNIYDVMSTQLIRRHCCAQKSRVQLLIALLSGSQFLFFHTNVHTKETTSSMQSSVPSSGLSQGAAKQHVCDGPLLSGAFLQSQLVAELIVAAHYELQASL